MCKYCENDTCCGNCWSAIFECLKSLLCCCCPGRVENENFVYEPRPLSPLTPNSDSGSSVDFDEFAVNIDGMVHPDAGADVSRTLTEPYNCWSWSINPLTHRLTWEDPPNINTVTSVQELAAVVNDYLRTTYGCTIVQYEGATVVEHLQAIDGNQFVIAMRTGAPAGDHHPISYHFARYIFGQWSYKDGAQGRLIMARANTPELEPDSFWKEHDDMTHMRTGTRRFPCNTDSERRTILNNNIVYTSKTIYLIITLPTG